MEQLLLTAIGAALRAGKAIMRVYASAFDVQIKDDQSPVTAADLEASKIIKDELAVYNWPFISEEDIQYSSLERSRFTRYWLVDPLDGTMEFVKRNDEFTVNIALIENKKPVLGVIYAPVFDTLWFNINKGVYKLIGTHQLSSNFNLDDLCRSAISLPQERAKRPFTVLVSRSHRTLEVDQYIKRFLLPLHPDLIIDSYGSSLKFARLAEATADVYVCYSKTKEWDTAAAEAILCASGGQVLRISDDMPLEYNKPEFANPPFVAWSNLK